MGKKRLGIIIAIASILIIAGIAQFLFARLTTTRSLPVTTESEAENVATVSSDSQTKSAEEQKPSTPQVLSLAKGDTIASWDFKGAYAGNAELAAKAKAEIERLSGLIGKGQYSDVTLYVGIANQYDLLGDGKREYDTLANAIKASETLGLPWHNLGVLMARLGALRTARAAYGNAAFLQPELKFYHYAYLDFLTERMSDDAISIEKAFAAAAQNIGQDAYLSQLRSRWEQSR